MYLFFITLWRALLSFAHALRAPFERGRRLSGGLLIAFAMPLFCVWQLIQLLGLLLDNIVFRAYRRIAIQQPVFIIGPPRTGTTFLHHMLASDPQTTTFRTWECLFATSISLRYLGIGLSRLHRWLGAPLSRVGSGIIRRLTSALNDIHPIRLRDPEEDFLSLMPLFACFLLIVPLPRARWLYRIARADTRLSQAEQAALFGFYRRAIQRHLYLFGQNKTFVSKNASFAGSVNCLLREFPDARIIATIRDPVSAVPSQLSSLRPGFASCGFAGLPDDFQDRMLTLFEHYYLNLADCARRHAGQVAFIDNSELRHHLEFSVRRAYRELGLKPSAALLKRLADPGDDTPTKASTHRYALEEFGLDAAGIRSRFRAVYASFDFNVSWPAESRDDE